MSGGTGDRLTTLLRRPDGLFGIVSVRRTEFARPKPPAWDSDPAENGLSDEAPYLDDWKPLSEIPDALIPGRKPLLAAYDALADVTALNGEVLANLLLVLSETVADPFADAPPTPVQTLDEPAPPPRATAAHPRAFRGTKYKPPKPPQPESVDLRQCLGIIAEESRLLVELSLFLDDALWRLDRIPAVGEALRKRGTGVLRPFGQNWSAETAARIAALPAQFQRRLLWNLRARTWDEIGPLLAAFWTLDLEHDGALRGCIGRLLAQGQHFITKDWCEAIARIPAKRRVHFAELLIETGAFVRTADERIINDLALADSLSADGVYRHRMHYALETVFAQHSLSYALDGFRIANEFREWHEFDLAATVEGAAAAIADFSAHVSEAGSWSRGEPMSLWEKCAKLDGFADLLAHPAVRRLDAEDACRTVQVLSRILYDEISEDVLRRKWAFLRTQFEPLVDFLAQIDDDYRAKALDALEYLLWYWDDPTELAEDLPPFCGLLRRLCASPFRIDGYSQHVLTALRVLPAIEWDQISRADNASFAAIETATVRENDANLIRAGLWSFVVVAPRLVADAFVRSPRQLLRTSHALGVLSTPQRRELIASFKQHPLSVVPVGECDAPALVALVEQHVRDGVANPIPRRLREHVSGKRALDAAQVQRDLALVREGWLALQLDVLRQLALDRMAAGLPAAPRTSQFRHALMLQRDAEEHRRSLRRLLKAYLRGDRAAREQHPSNREWLAKRDSHIATKWLEGICFRGAAGSAGVLELTVERDPLEILRLGSYFGTCLGLGGSMTYSAVAVALDINKQVVYARNAHRGIVARQLIAMAEDGRLVCFKVYPASADSAIRALFRDFDMQFANALGVRIFEPPEEGRAEEYDIASIVARKFYDDDAWNLRITDE